MTVIEEEFDMIPSVCSYCGCDFHEGDEVVVVQHGNVSNFFGDQFELTTTNKGVKLFHKFCKFMKEETKENGK